MQSTWLIIGLTIDHLPTASDNLGSLNYKCNAGYMVDYRVNYKSSFHCLPIPNKHKTCGCMSYKEICGHLCPIINVF